MRDVLPLHLKRSRRHRGKTHDRIHELELTVPLDAGTPTISPARTSTVTLCSLDRCSVSLQLIPRPQKTTSPVSEPDAVM